MKKRKFWVDHLPALLTGILIIVMAVWRQQTLLKTLPTLITLVVQVLNAHADRRGFLLGAANAMLYGLASASEGIYFSAINCFAVSAPIQIYSYFSWKRHSAGKLVELRFLGCRKLLVSIGAVLSVWAVCNFGLARFFQGAAYPAVDTLSFSIGIVISLMAAKRFIDSQYFNIVSCILSLVLWILLTIRNTANFNYVIISAYNLFRVTEAAVIWTKNTILIKKVKEKTI